MSGYAIANLHNPDLLIINLMAMTQSRETINLPYLVQQGFIFYEQFQEKCNGCRNCYYAYTAS